MSSWANQTGESAADTRNSMETSQPVGLQCFLLLACPQPALHPSGNALLSLSRAHCGGHTRCCNHLTSVCFLLFSESPLSLTLLQPLLENQILFRIQHPRPRTQHPQNKSQGQGNASNIKPSLPEVAQPPRMAGPAGGVGAQQMLHSVSGAAVQDVLPFWCAPLTYPELGVFHEKAWPQQ